MRNTHATRHRVFELAQRTNHPPEDLLSPQDGKNGERLVDDLLLCTRGSTPPPHTDELQTDKLQTDIEQLFKETRPMKQRRMAEKRRAEQQRKRLHSGASSGPIVTPPAESPATKEKKASRTTEHK